MVVNHPGKRKTNEDMPSLYSKANLFVFPSLFEGFGAPVLEALFSKVPVVASKGGAIEEAGGTGSLFIDPTNVNELADAILNVLTNDELKHKMAKAGYIHAQTMTDKIFAEKAMHVYRQLLK